MPDPKCTDAHVNLTYDIFEMTNPIPLIAVQLIHIQGPLKGEIQEFRNSPVSIGRHSSCNVVFPADMTIISRRHAEIIREGNRFKLIDRSTNGTFVNGKPVTETYLRDGDVLIFAEGGPKVSFLTQTVQPGPADRPAAGKEPSLPPEMPAVPQPKPPPQAEIRPSCPGPQGPVETVRVPLVIQYGPTLRAYKQVPVTIGKNPDCDFSLDHPDLADRHAQIFFSAEQYWIKDLTGRQSISVNRQPIDRQAPFASG